MKLKKLYFVLLASLFFGLSYLAEVSQSQAFTLRPAKVNPAIDLYFGPQGFINPNKKAKTLVKYKQKEEQNKKNPKTQSKSLGKDNS